MGALPKKCAWYQCKGSDASKTPRRGPEFGHQIDKKIFQPKER